MKIIKTVLLSLTIFLCACARANNQTQLTGPEAAAESVSGVRYVQKNASGENIIIKNGAANVYRRSSIENAGTKKAGVNNAEIEKAVTPIEIVEAVEPDYKSMTASERAKRISNAITNIKGIDTASVVISGNTAIVGIEHKGHLDDMLLLKLKREIDAIAKAADGGIKNVAVTAAPELVSRVTRMTNSEKSEKNMSEAE